LNIEVQWQLEVLGVSWLSGKSGNKSIGRRTKQREMYRLGARKSKIEQSYMRIWVIVDRG